MDEQIDAKVAAPTDGGRHGGTTLYVPAGSGVPELSVHLPSTREAEARLVEAKDVGPSNYLDLEHCFNEAYRELRRGLAAIQWQVARTSNAIELVKAEVYLDKWPAYMDGKPKSHDNADARKAFLARDPGYAAALERMDRLRAMESLVDGRIKVMENVCRYMRKKMDLIIRGGVASQVYSSGKR